MSAAAAARVVALARAAGLRLAVAESCTGGLVCAALTGVPGSSAVLERGFVTYSNEAKAEMLGVAPDLIAAHGAVSAEVARAMAEAALARSGVGMAVSITGVAGPGGGSASKPVGLVHFGLAVDGAPTGHEEHQFGDLGREEVRRRSVERALGMMEEALRGTAGSPIRRSSG